MSAFIQDLYRYDHSQWLHVTLISEQSTIPKVPSLLIRACVSFQTTRHSRDGVFFMIYGLLTHICNLNLRWKGFEHYSSSGFHFFHGCHLRFNLSTHIALTPHLLQLANTTIFPPAYTTQTAILQQLLAFLDFVFLTNSELRGRGLHPFPIWHSLSFAD